MALLEKECVALSPQLGPLRILPLHAGLGGLTQRVFESDPEASTRRENDGETEGADSSVAGAGGPSFRRKVIVSDILAEASFSLPAIRYVIDTGLQLKTVSLGSIPDQLDKMIFFFWSLYLYFIYFFIW